MAGRIAQIKRTIVSVVGFTILFLGIAMILLPGPAFILIPLGLGILASEYPWARRMLERIKGWIQRKADHRAHREDAEGTEKREK